MGVGLAIHLCADYLRGQRSNLWFDLGWMWELPRLRLVCGSANLWWRRHAQRLRLYAHYMHHSKQELRNHRRWLWRNAQLRYFRVTADMRGRWSGQSLWLGNVHRAELLAAGSDLWPGLRRL